MRVEFFETAHVCSAASKKKKHAVTVFIDPKSTSAIPYVIIPMEVGEHQIEVQAAIAGWGFHDGIKKTLKVVVSISGFASLFYNIVLYYCIVTFLM